MKKYLLAYLGVGAYVAFLQAKNRPDSPITSTLGAVVLWPSYVATMSQSYHAPRALNGVWR